MSDERPRSEFTDVDRAENPSDYLRMLDAQRAMPFIRQYKLRVRTLLDLQPGLHVLDAGTGTGEDAQEMAKLVDPGGVVVGLDMSRIMIEEAKRRVAVDFCIGIGDANGALFSCHDVVFYQWAQSRLRQRKAWLDTNENGVVNWTGADLSFRIDKLACIAYHCSYDRTKCSFWRK